jgi:hypothetical protein
MKASRGSGGIPPITSALDGSNFCNFYVDASEHKLHSMSSVAISMVFIVYLSMLSVSDDRALHNSTINE